MVTADDLLPGVTLPDPITINVTSVSWNVGGRRAVVEAVDSVGNPIRFIDFKGANIEIDWQKNRTYQISRCNVKRGSGGFDLQLEPTARTQIDFRDSSPDVTRLFVLGDTHVGYRHRSRSEKNKWSRNVDCRDVFRQCLKRARIQSVDAVIHAGDVFDHGNTSNDRDLVKREINRLARSGIPFYYVHGNHDDDAGKDALKSSQGVHLSNTPEQIEGESLTLLGVDHLGSKFPTEPPQTTIELLLHPTILVTHEKLYPVVNDRGKPIYNSAGNVANISNFFSEASYDIDYLVSGHQHLAREGSVRDSGVPAMVTGAPASLRKPLEDNPFSTWVLKLEDGSFTLSRDLI